MKHLRKVLSIVVIVALTLTSVMVADTTNVMAKTKVKSFKVKGAKKTLNMTVGQTKKFKINIKETKKKYRKFTVKSSNKKVVKVSKSTKWVKLKALKAGKAKVTIKAKYNKKKKKVITVKVKAKAKIPPKTDPVKVPLTMEVAGYNYQTIVVRFNRATTVKADDISIERKEDESLPAEKLKVKKLATNNNKSYGIILDNNINYDFIKLSVTAEGQTFTKEFQALNDDITGDYSCTCYGRVGRAIDEELYIGYFDSTRKIKSITDLPDGFTCTVSGEDCLKVTGTPTESGIYKFKVVVEEKVGTRTITVAVVVSSSSELQVYEAEATAYAYNSGGEKLTASGTIVPDITGGSGDYTLELVGSDSGVFSVYNDYDPENDMYLYGIGYETANPGIYTVQVRATDANDERITKVFTATLVVKKYIQVKGKVTNAKGVGIGNVSVYTEFMKEDCAYEETVTDSEGNYTLYTEPGNVNIFARFDYKLNTMIPDLNITSNSTYNMVVDGAYVINIAKNNLIPKYGKWFDGDVEGDFELVGSNDKVFLSAGKHNLVCNGYAKIDGKYQKYKATKSIDVSADMTVTPDIEMTSVDYENQLEMGDNGVTLSSSDKYFLFVPTTTSIYRFKSEFSDEDPMCELFDLENNLIGEADDDIGANFNLEVELEAGVPYILCCSTYGATETGIISVTDANR